MGFLSTTPEDDEAIAAGSPRGTNQLPSEAILGMFGNDDHVGTMPTHNGQAVGYDPADRFDAWHDVVDNLNLEDWRDRDAAFLADPNGMPEPGPMPQPVTVEDFGHGPIGREDMQEGTNRLPPAGAYQPQEHYDSHGNLTGYFYESGQLDEDGVPKQDPYTLAGAPTAIGKGIVAGLAHATQFAQDAEAGAGEFTQAHPWSWAIPGIATLAASNLVPEEERRANQQHLDDTIAWTKSAQDPMLTGQIGRTGFDVAKGITEYGLGAVAGPWGAASMLAGSSGDEDYRDLRTAGVDQRTAGVHAVETALTNAAFALLPVKFGGALIPSTAKAVGAGVGIGMASRALQSDVLDSNGYHDMAATVRPFDWDSILSDAVMTGFFNAAGHVGAKLAQKLPVPNPSEVDAAMAAQVETHYNNSGFGIPTDPGITNLHTDTLGAHIDAMSRDMEPPPIDPDVAQKLADGVILDPQQLGLAQAIHEALNADPDVAQVRAAPVVKPVEMPFTAAPPEVTADEAAGITPEDAEASTRPATIDPVTWDTMANLRANHGDQMITTDDGRQIPISQHLDEMEQQARDADKFADLFHVAVSCFLSTGGAQ